MKSLRFFFSICLIMTGIFVLLALAEESNQNPAMLIPDTPYELDYFINKAHNGIVGRSLSNYGLLKIDSPGIRSAIKDVFHKDKRAREIVLVRITEFINKNIGKAPIVILIGENHNDPIAARLLNYILRRVPGVTHLGMEAFLNDPTRATELTQNDFEELDVVLNNNKNKVLILLDRQEEKINTYESKLLQRLIMDEGQQSVINAFLAGDVAIPNELNMADLLYGEEKLHGSPQGIDNVKLLALSILITAVNAIDEDGMLTRLETMEICRRQHIKAFGFHQPVSLMNVSNLSEDRNNYYTWTLDNYYSQVVNKYLSSTEDRNQVVMVLSIGAAHAERSHLPMFLPIDCQVMVVDLAGTCKIIEDALDKAKLGLETGWIDLEGEAKKEGYLSSRQADLYLHYPTPAQAPY